MLWFSMQSLLMLLLAFVVGLLVGWLAWGRQWQPVPDAADLDVRPGSRHRADEGADGSGTERVLAATATDEPSRLDALLASLTQPDESRSTPVVGVAPRAASESVAATNTPTEDAPVDTPAEEYVAATTTTRQGAAEAVSLIAAAAQRVAERPEARPVEPTTGSFRTTFEPTTDPFGLALASAPTAARPETSEVTLAALGEHLAQTGRPRSESVFHEDDDLVTVLNQSHHAPATLDPGSAMIDDLTRIEGVNPAMASALAAEGLRTYEDVAAATEDRLRRALRIARIRSAPGIGFWAPRAAKLVQQRASEVSSPSPTPEASPPVSETPAPAAPVTGAPVTEAPVEATLDVATLDEATADEAPTDEAPADEAPADEAPADEAPADEATADEAPTDEATTDEGLVDEAPVDDPADDEATFDALLSEPLTAADHAEGFGDEVVALPATRPEGPTTPRHAEPTTPARGAARLGAGDDLEQIGGVGRRISEVLQAAGITSFVQLAAARDHELRTILTDAGVRQPASLVTWSVQAALLLQGDVEGAATLADGLMTGRETG